jgi:hypothetical protein
VRILVGGETRKCGKTALVCAILRAFPGRRWLAVKVTPHRHSEENPEGGDTARYLRAGAAEARLVEAEGAEAAALVEELAREWSSCVVEGTGVGAWLEADCRLLVRSSSCEWKAVAADEVFRPDAYVGEARADDKRPSFVAGSEELLRFLAERWK